MTAKPVRERATLNKQSAAAVPKSADHVPLQLRLPRQEVRAIKIAAAEREVTISEFMLTCFHAHTKP